MRKHASAFGSVAVFVTALLLASPLGALAAKPAPASTTIDPVSLAVPSNTTQALVSVDSAQKVGKIINNAPTIKTKTGVSAMAAYVPIAAVSVFADPSDKNSSGSGGILNFGSHAWITVKNISTSNIQIGAFAPIPPGKTMSIGTWGSISTGEHNGMYYDLESYRVNIKGYYPDRISMTVNVNSTDLSRLNAFITDRVNNFWTPNVNCSSFAVRAWNSVILPQYALSVKNPNTPRQVVDEMKAKYAQYIWTQAPVPYDYSVVYFDLVGNWYLSRYQ